jgi:hypothetical protein
MPYKLQLRRSAAFSGAVVLADGEPAFIPGTSGGIKIGNGSTPVSALPFVVGQKGDKGKEGPAGKDGVGTKGDKGDTGPIGPAGGGTGTGGLNVIVQSASAPPPTGQAAGFLITTSA